VEKAEETFLFAFDLWVQIWFEFRNHHLVVLIKPVFKSSYLRTNCGTRSNKSTWPEVIQKIFYTQTRYIPMLSKAEMKVNCSSAIFIDNLLPHTNIPPICCNRLSSAFSVLQDESNCVRVLIIARTWSKYSYRWRKVTRRLHWTSDTVGCETE